MNIIGPVVIHDLVDAHEALRTIMCECKAQADTVSFEEVEPASISGKANIGRGVILQNDTCSTVGIVHCAGELEIPRVNAEVLAYDFPAVGRGDDVLAGVLGFGRLVDVLGGKCKTEGLTLPQEKHPRAQRDPRQNLKAVASEAVAL